jgi:hypothetical protein
MFAALIWISGSSPFEEVHGRSITLLCPLRCGSALPSIPSAESALGAGTLEQDMAMTGNEARGDDVK